MRFSFNKKVGITAAGGLILAALSLVFALSKKDVVAFYGLTEKESAGIKEVLLSTDDEKFNPKKLSFVELNASENLSRQIKKIKPAVLYCVSGKEFSDFSKSAQGKIAATEEISAALENVTSSMRPLVSADSVRENSYLKSAPLLSGNYEIDINMDFYRQLKTESISTWQDIENFARQSKKNFNAGIFVDFKNADSTLNFFGALAESLNGKQSYLDAVEIISKAETSSELNLAADELTAGPFQKPLEMLRSWNEKNLFTTGTFSADTEDFGAFLKSKTVAVAFMTLSTHRKFGKDEIGNFSSIYVPSEIPASARVFTAPVVYFSPLKNSRTTRFLTENMFRPETQKRLSDKTGLAPVLRNSACADRQADDARFWIAATNPPYAGLSRDITLSESGRQILAQNLTAEIQRKNQ